MFTTFTGVFIMYRCSMMSGFLVCSIGMSLTLMSQNVLFTMVAILIFSLGEMVGFISGVVYQQMLDKVMIV